MKKVRIMLAAVLLTGVMAGVLAFKNKKSEMCLFTSPTYSTNFPQTCILEQQGIYALTQWNGILTVYYRSTDPEDCWIFGETTFCWLTTQLTFE